MQKLNLKTLLALAVLVGTDLLLRCQHVAVPPELVAPASALILSLFPSLSPALADFLGSLLTSKAAKAVLPFLLVGLFASQAACGALTPQQKAQNEADAAASASCATAALMQDLGATQASSVVTQILTACYKNIAADAVDVVTSVVSALVGAHRAGLAHQDEAAGVCR